jgi:hypothetical protein
MNKGLLLAGVLGLASCAVQQQKVVQTTTFDAEAARAQLAPGAASLAGSALMRQRGGGVVTCGGLKVSLVPETVYARERMEIIYGSSQGGFYRLANVAGNRQPAESDPEYMALARETVCDAQGEFEFTELSAGAYYITAPVVWSVPGNNLPEGGILMRRVQLVDGQRATVVLTP